MQTEHVILLNAQGVPTGTLEKYAAHTADTLLHLAFSSWLFNAKGQLLVTRRALSKKAWPGVWTNSVCGHPQLGESNEEAVIRRCRYELGVEITPPESIYPDFRYRATDPNGIVENEVCPVFAARTTSALQINDDEMMDYQWCDLADVLRGIDATPWAFSPWMVMQATNREARKRLSAFTQLK
ncbi:isopentenyl-diphosphate Delta-isomerase [Escherichia coli]|nr:isopentenyl-diphosphate Delta-isomerase [Escherichia coli]